MWPLRPVAVCALAVPAMAATASAPTLAPSRRTVIAAAAVVSARRMRFGLPSACSLAGLGDKTRILARLDARHGGNQCPQPVAVTTSAPRRPNAPDEKRKRFWVSLR